MRDRDVRAWCLTLALGVVLTGCGRPAPEHPAPSADGPPAEASATGALPRYLTVEVRPDGSIVVGGEPLEASALSERALIDRRQHGIDQAALIVTTEARAEILGDMVEQLVASGYRHVVVSVREGGELVATEPPAQPAAAEAVSEPPPPPTTGAGTAPTASATEPRTASVRQLGLHVGGGPNDDQTKAQFHQPIEARYDALAACHARALDRSGSHSVGVDLLIPAGGGQAELRDFRSKLRGEAFRGCVSSVLSEVRFPAPPKGPTIISYSVMFEPVR